MSDDYDRDYKASLQVMRRGNPSVGAAKPSPAIERDDVIEECAHTAWCEAIPGEEAAKQLKRCVDAILALKRATP